MYYFLKVFLINMVILLPGYTSTVYFVALGYTLCMIVNTLLGFGLFKWNIEFILSTLGMLTWGLRLAYYLGKRYSSSSYKESRTKETKSFNIGWYKKIFFHAPCALLYTLYYLGVYLLKDGCQSKPIFYFGFLLQVLGIYIEAMSDHQKDVFKRTHSGPIFSGLWKYSRHMNYFGEILFWTGTSVSGYSASKNIVQSFLLLLIPITMYMILYEGIMMTATGQIRRYGKIEAYIKYFKTTPMFFPFFHWNLEKYVLEKTAKVYHWTAKSDEIIAYHNKINGI